MSKIEWERDLVEQSFCRQLEAMGWSWIEVDPDLPESTERTSSHECCSRAGWPSRRGRLRALQTKGRAPSAKFASLGCAAALGLRCLAKLDERTGSAARRFLSRWSQASPR
jgi:hypothetical protein